MLSLSVLLTSSVIFYINSDGLSFRYGSMSHRSLIHRDEKNSCLTSVELRGETVRSLGSSGAAPSICGGATHPALWLWRYVVTTLALAPPARTRYVYNSSLTDLISDSVKRSQVPKNRANAPLDNLSRSQRWQINSARVYDLHGETARLSDLLRAQLTRQTPEPSYTRTEANVADSSFADIPFEISAIVTGHRENGGCHSAGPTEEPNTVNKHSRLSPVKYNDIRAEVRSGSDPRIRVEERSVYLKVTPVSWALSLQPRAALFWVDHLAPALQTMHSGIVERSSRAAGCGDTQTHTATDNCSGNLIPSPGKTPSVVLTTVTPDWGQSTPAEL
ncbi:hypothetical protein RRG08_058840 [Elysia crispata]|uniref:Uncharacterized protein n=1 Tax=Elysia crispata TaxID=231223 RepID=A0AAE0XZW8_9GAST|nr:hypothetical protein RRG08_058840 [Elysia crispata]